MKMGEIFFDIKAIVSDNWFNIKEIIDAINNLLKRYGVNGAAYVILPTKLEFANGAIIVGKIFAGQEEYTFSFFKTGNAAIFPKDTGMSPATAIARGNHLEILVKFFDFVGSKLRINIKRRKKMGGIFCELPSNKEQKKESTEHSLSIEALSRVREI